MKKIILALPLIAALTLVGCTSNDRSPDAQPMAPEAMVTILTSGDTVVPTEPPQEGSVFHWDEGASSYTATGRYSVTFDVLDGASSTLCFDDNETLGAVQIVTQAGDFSTYFNVSLEGTCEDFTQDVAFKWEPSGGPSRYDVIVSSVDGTELTQTYVDALQSYADAHRDDEFQLPDADTGEPEPIPSPTATEENE